MKTRSEKEMFDLILGVAESDSRIRAVVLNGSRADQSARRDCFQDYDIVFFVNDIRSFTRDHSWIDVFGERMILQMPDDWHDHPYDYTGSEPFIYLMQFMDGNRIDLSLNADGYIDDGEPAVALLDKDNMLPEFGPPTGACYFVKPPDEKEFSDCCNEFWWLGPYIAKGLWRGELAYTKFILEYLRRSDLVKMLGWYAGLKHGLQIGIGKRGGKLAQYLSHAEYEAFERTFLDYKKENIWEALFAMNELFFLAAQTVSSRFGFYYPQQDEDRVTAYLNHVRRMPLSSKSIYPSGES